jgi:hypothetical protein
MSRQFAASTRNRWKSNLQASFSRMFEPFRATNAPPGKGRL